MCGGVILAPGGKAGGAEDEVGDRPRGRAPVLMGVGGGVGV